ncbi:MAG TPA: carboxypeptidase-like regulatory domain-containing protein, partial [Sphingomonadaceae bacterium]|nr:carboxypeptidase-like regulatory domain-containing protein [Sphingomonadaceae bacterium]
RAGRYVVEGDVRGYRTDYGTCLDFGDVIQVLDLPVRLDRKSRRATGWLFAEERKLTIDRDSNTVQIVNKVSDLGAGEIYDTPEGWCIDARTLSGWFGIQLTADPFNQVLRLEGDPSLPFLQAIERRSRAARLRPKRQEFDLSKLPQADLPYEAWRQPSVDMVVDLAFNKQGQSTRTRVSYEIFASGEVAGASFDARFASNANGEPGSLRLRAFRVDPDGGLLGPLGATKVAIGDVETESTALTGRNGRGRGAIISNKPLLRPASFSQTTIRGAMPSGWDAELYRNGQLIAFQGGSLDGFYEFIDVDLLYGKNDLEVVLYGPQGQVRREATSIPVGQANIEPGKMHYWAAIIEQGKDLLTFNSDFVDPLTGWRWGVGVERGIDKRTTAGISAQSMVINGQRRNILEMNLRRAVGPMLVELSAAQSFGRGRAYQAEALGQLGKVNFNFRTLWIDGEFESEIIEGRIRSESSFSADTSLKLGRLRVPVQAGFRRETDRDGQKVNEWLIRGSLVGRGLSVTAALSNQWTENPYGPPRVEDGMRLNLLANTRIGQAKLRGEARFRLSGLQKGFESARLTGDIPLTERSDLRAEVEHFSQTGRTDFSLGYIREFKQFALQANGTVGTQGNIGFGLQLSMSMGPNPISGGVRFSHEKLARTGQTAVTVFRDENGDGRRSPGEMPVEGIAVEAGFTAGENVTGENGVAIIEGMRPYAPILVSIDESTLPDPYLQPVGKGIVVTPRPGIAANIELALAPTGEVEGEIHGLAGTPLAGVELELVNGLGEVVATTVSEFDGFFLFDGVLYGQYRLRVSESSAVAIGAQQGLGTVEISRDNDIGRMGIVKLKRDSIASEQEATPLALAELPD